MLSFFPRGVLDEILNLIESVSEEFPSFVWTHVLDEISDLSDSVSEGFPTYFWTHVFESTAILKLRNYRRFLLVFITRSCQGLFDPRLTFRRRSAI